MSEPLKVLFYDIETAPLIAYVWSPRADWIPHGQMVHETFLLCWSAKWLGDKTVHSDVMTSAEAVRQNDKRVASSLAAMVREADIIVAHNGDRFDLPKLNNRLLFHRLEAIAPTTSIDTLKLAKKNFALVYNKLDWLADQLGFGSKIKTEFEWWKACYFGDEKMLAKMVRYNRKDVVLLEQVFHAIRPYCRGLPRLVDAEDVGEGGCSHCGSKHVHRRGTYRTKASSFPQWHCLDCGLYSRGRPSNNIRLALIPL